MTDDGSRIQCATKRNAASRCGSRSANHPALQENKGHAARDGRMGQWLLGSRHFQRFASRDAGRGRRLHAAVPDFRPRRHCRAPWRGAAAVAPAEATGAGGCRFARHCGPGRGDRFPVADRACASTHHLGPFHRLHRPVAASDRDLRRVARRGKAEAELSGFSPSSARSSLRVSRIAQSGSASVIGDLLMVAAILLCGLGYAEGATLSRRLGGWQVISWALSVGPPRHGGARVCSHYQATFSGIGLPVWLSLAYVSVFSMLVGFVFWYRGLALGGIAGVGQLQLLQPFFGLLLAGLLLHEPVAWSMIAVTALVVLCVAGAKRYAKRYA